MENNKKNILDDEALKAISGGVRLSRPRPGNTHNTDDWAMPENYAINGISYQEALAKMSELAAISKQSAIDYANTMLFPHQGWQHIYNEGVEYTVSEMFTYHYRNN